LSIDREKPKYQFPGAQRPAELGQLLLQASDALNAHAP